MTIDDGDTPYYQTIDVKKLIWREVIANPDYSIDQLQHALRKAKMRMSAVTSATLAADFRRILTFLIREGLINERRLHARQRTEQHHLSTQRQAILHALNKVRHSLGPNAIANATKMRSNNVRFRLHEMVKDGDVERVEHGKYRRKQSDPVLPRKRPFRPWHFSG
jgi:hypothetical protein